MHFNGFGDRNATLDDAGEGAHTTTLSRFAARVMPV
jgi:hypothetical protein